MPLDISKGIGRTFSFLFGHIVDVLKIAWLPIVLQLAAFYLLMPGYVRATGGLTLAREPEEVAAAWGQALPGFGMFALFMLITFVSSIAMVVGITRLTLKGEKPRAPFYLGWGKDEWRLMAGWLIFAAIIAGLVILLQGGGFLLRGLVGGGPIGAMIILVVYVVLVVAIFVVCVRLSLLAPATLVTGKMSLRESWERTDDHFWGFLGFWLLFFLMFLVVYLLIYFNFSLPPGYFGAFAGMNPREPDSMREAMEKANGMLIASYDFSNIGNALRQTPGALIGPICGVITTIAGATAWKLTSEEEPAAE
jgi:hypothetical protein